MKKIVFLITILWSGIINGQQYFQQEVNYNINVKLNDKTHTLIGFEEFEYHNNSDSNLTFLYIHVWPNAYKNNKTALAKQLFSLSEGIMGGETLEKRDKEVYGYIDSLDFKINGVKSDWEFDEKHIDIIKINLLEPLKKGEKITVSTPFKVKIPSGEISRLGHIGESYQITQWYPKPAVFDKKGWHQMPYLNQGEFYSEYGSFDVSITLPKNYVVGATGDLQTQSEINFLNKKAKKGMQFSKASIAIPSSLDYKTIRYTQKNVHDFAWFADKNYQVLKGEVQLPHSKRKVTTWLMSTPQNAHLWKNALPYINDGIYYYSLWNGDYPYNQATAVDGTISAGGGMEYPNVTVIGNSFDPRELETIIVHEVGHNWFYGQLGSNERVYPWLDEGINTANETRYFETKYPNEIPTTGDAISCYYSICSGRNQPIESHSKDFTPINYGSILYTKTGLMLSYLRDYLGDDLYDKSMMNYYKKWEYKHPQPNDIKEAFEKTTNKDLSWFFEDIIKTNKKIDFKIKSLKSIADNKKEVHVINKRSINMPLKVNGFIKDSLVESIWLEPNEKFGVFNNSKIEKVEINSRLELLDVNVNNNKTDGTKLFSKLEPIHFKMSPSFGLKKGNRIMYTPIIGANVYDKTMLGIMFNNVDVPRNNIEYIIAPLYSFGKKGLSGLADIHKIYLGDKNINKLEYGVSFKSFKDNLYGLGGDYLTVKPYVNIDISKLKMRQNITHNIDVFGAYINHTNNTSNQNNYLGLSLNYTLAYLKHKHSLIIKPNVDYIEETALKAANANMSVSATYSYKYFKKSYVELRGFAGKNLIYNSFYGNRTKFSLGGQNGSQDYFYEHYMFGRNENSGLLSQQRIANHGDFKTVSDFGTSNNWMVSTNLFVQSPVIKAIGVYADYGMFDNNTKIEHAYDLGLGIRFLDNHVSVYFPLLESNNLKNANAGLKYQEKIRFNLNLNFFKLSTLFNLLK